MRKHEKNKQTNANTISKSFQDTRENSSGESCLQKAF
jgi:hypothetical protein